MGISYHCDLCKTDTLQGSLTERLLMNKDMLVAYDLCPSCDRNYRILCERFIKDGGKIE